MSRAACITCCVSSSTTYNNLTCACDQHVHATLTQERCILDNKNGSSQVRPMNTLVQFRSNLSGCTYPYQGSESSYHRSSGHSAVSPRLWPRNRSKHDKPTIRIVPDGILLEILTTAEEMRSTSPRRCGNRSYSYVKDGARSSLTRPGVYICYLSAISEPR